MPYVQWDVGEMMRSSASLKGLSRLIPLNVCVPGSCWVLGPAQAPGVPHLVLWFACLGHQSPLPLVKFLRASLTLGFDPQLLLPNPGVKVPHGPFPWCRLGVWLGARQPTCAIPFAHSDCWEESKAQAGASPASALQSLSCRYK